MAPDLLSFGPFFLSRLGDIGERWAKNPGPPDPSIIPAYVYHAYNVSHSLVVWAALVGICYFIWRSRGKTLSLIPLGAWALHILCDIPTHSVRFFPTPFLWPFTTPFYDGTPWGNRPFMIGNYAALTLTYLILKWKRKASS